MPAYVIAQCTIADRKLYDEYVDKLVPILGMFKAQILSVDEEPLVMDGEVNSNRVAIVKFESKQHVIDLFHSPEYQEILPIRRKAIPGTFMVVEGREAI